MKISKKIVLLGNYGVGKTSLIDRFVYQKFPEEYLTTIGVKISKKTVRVNGVELSLIIWDIAGESTNDKIPDSYKLGAHGVMYVIDVTRPSSYLTIDQEILTLKMILPNVPIVKVANKIDLLTEKTQNEIDENLSLDEFVLCSAKTGDNVEFAFKKLAVKCYNEVQGF